MPTPLDTLLKLNLQLPTTTSLANVGIPTPIPSAPGGQPPLAVPQAAPQPQPQQQVSSQNFFNDPTALLELGAMLLQPRSEAQGQFGFVANALNESVQNFSKRNVQAEDRALQREAASQSIAESKTNQKATERKLQSQDTLDELNLARTTAEEARAQKFLAEAENERKTGGKNAKLPAAEVQVIDLLSKQLKTLRPDKYTGTEGDAQAKLDAFTLRERSGQNPALWYADAVSRYLENATLATPEEQIRTITALKALRDTLTNSLPSTEVPAQKEVVGDTSNKQEDPDKVVIQSGIFKGFTKTQAQDAVKLWKTDPVRFENDLNSKYPDPTVREQVRQKLEALMERI